MHPRIRKFVRERAQDRCEYCRLRQDAAPVVRFQVEHIRARQHGGDDADENLALACARCNGFKGTNLTAIDPETDEIVTVFNPRTEHWSEHFVLVGIEIQGVTATGRATVELLQMNAGDRLKARAALIERGEWDS
jgi:hypothetical protein